MRCILCLRPTTSREPEEHIVDEGLIGHTPFRVQSYGGDSREDLLTLRNGEVCGRCNGDVGRLGEHLQKQLGFFKVLINAVGTKSGKSATFERPGMYVYRVGDHVHVVLNGEMFPVTAPDGHVVQPARQHPDSVRSAGVRREGDLAHWGFSQQFRFNKKCFRALHKIAFELLCYTLGTEHVLDPRYNSIRDYILRGRGRRAILMGTTAPVGPEMDTGLTVIPIPAWNSWICDIRLGARFVVDLSPDNRLARESSDAVPDPKEIQLLWDDHVQQAIRAAGKACRTRVLVRRF